MGVVGAVFAGNNKAVRNRISVGSFMMLVGPNSYYWQCILFVRVAAQKDTRYRGRMLEMLCEDLKPRRLQKKGMRCWDQLKSHKE
jgi:hypothetical protein